MSRWLRTDSHDLEQHNGFFHIILPNVVASWASYVTVGEDRLVLFASEM